MLIDEENVVLEACVQMWLKSKLNNNRVMVTVYMRVDSVKSLKSWRIKTGNVFGKATPRYLLLV